MMKPLSPDALQPTASPSTTAKSTPNKMGRQSVGSPSRGTSNRSLMPLARLSPSPTRMGSNLGASGGKKGVAKPPASAQDLAKAIRADLFHLQQLIDSRESRSLLNYNQRKLESEVLVLQQTASNSESEVMELLEMLAQKCTEATKALVPSTSVGKPVGVGVGAGGFSSLSRPAVATLPPKSIVGTLLESIQKASHRGTLTGHGESTNSHPIPSLADESSSAIAGGQLSRSGSPDQLVATGIREEGDEILPPPAGVQHSSPELAGDFTTVVLTKEPLTGTQTSRLSDQSIGLPNFGARSLATDGSRMGPLSAGSLAALAALGIDLPQLTAGGEEEGLPKLLDSDAIVRQLLHAARTVQTKEALLEHRIKATMESSVVRQRQVEIAAEQRKVDLIETEHELNKLKESMHGSRFTPNVVRPLATAKDEPMSYQVEQQYQKDLHKTHLRIQELEKKYEDLWNSGIDDRATVKRLTQEGVDLRASIVDLEKQLQKAKDERDENTALYKGVSQARNEEARMSLVAVKQLETRVEELEAMLENEKKEKEYLMENFRNLYLEYNKNEKILQQYRYRQESTVDSFNDYKQLYHTGLVSMCQQLQQELLRVYHLSDEQEAHLTLQKQQLEDNRVLMNLAAQESTNFIERLKSSTEWKMVGVRAVEESKQLAMRLVVLNGDKEKKESSMAAQHAERLQLYRTRADKEIEERGTRRNEEVQPVDSEAVDTEWKNRMSKRQQQLEEKTSSKAMERIRQTMKLKSDYSEACLQRIVSVADFYEERFPPEE